MLSQTVLKSLILKTYFYQSRELKIAPVAVFLPSLGRYFQIGNVTCLSALKHNSYELQRHENKRRSGEAVVIHRPKILEKHKHLHAKDFRCFSECFSFVNQVISFVLVSIYRLVFASVFAKRDIGIRRSCTAVHPCTSKN